MVNAMKHTLSSRLITSAVLLGAAALASCGGGGGNSAESPEGPSALFPNGVVNGNMKIGNAVDFRISVSRGDFTLGADYTANVDIKSLALSEEDRVITAKGLLRQADESQSGRIVLVFEDTVAPYISGNMVISIPQSGVDDNAHRRTGTVEQTSDLMLKDENDQEAPLQINGMNVSITW